jgi:ADP-ribose pyrophosphatase YjhB (NUDIX family)
MVVPLRMAREWEVLVLRRGPDKGALWAPVTGNVEAGESFEAAAGRELEEETGLASAAALRPTGYTNRFEKEVRGVRAAFEEAVFAAVVRPGARVRLSREHVDSRWVSVGEAVEMVAFDGCKEGVRRAVASVEP